MTNTWIYDLDYTLYEYHDNSYDFNYHKIIYDPNLKSKIKVTR